MVDEGGEFLKLSVGQWSKKITWVMAVTSTIMVKVETLSINFTSEWLDSVR
jgi:hypothetical protein